MDHIAIMKKSWKLIPLILSGEKTIESRWYKNKVAPWNKVYKDDVIYFKNSGEDVIAKAEVSKVLQFENLNEEIAKDIVEKYGDKIKLQNANYKEWINEKRYCILIVLKNPQEINPAIKIDKTGFGNAAAWMYVGNIQDVIVG